MNKAELIEIVAKEVDVSKAVAEKAINSVTGAITPVLLLTDAVTHSPLKPGPPKY